MDKRAQVAVEYLIMALFGIMLAMAAALLIDTIRNVAIAAQTQVLDYRQKTIESLLGP